MWPTDMNEYAYDPCRDLRFEGIYVANGLGASGLTAGPYLGSELAKLVLGKPTELDPLDYDVAGAIKKIE